MKKIAFVINDMIVGGVSSALIDMLNNFDYTRFDVTLWINGTVESNKVLLNSINEHVAIKYWKFNKNNTLIGKANQLCCRIGMNIFSGYSDVHTLFNMKYYDYNSEEYYDYVIAYQGISPVVIANVLWRFHSKKTILWLHGTHNRIGFSRRLYANIYKKFDKVFSVSNSAKNEFIDMYSYTKNDIEVIHNIVTPEKIIEKSNTKIVDELKSISIVTVGRLSKEKGQDMIPIVTKRIMEEGYIVYWYILGEGALRKDIEDEINKNHVNSNVFLMGTKDNPYPYMKKCDIYVQTSLTEGWCLTTQEAKILKKPIVTTNLPVMKEQFINGENGIIAEGTTPEALFMAIKLLIDNPELRQKLTANLCEEQYNVGNELQKLYDFIEGR